MKLRKYIFEILQYHISDHVEDALQEHVVDSWDLIREIHRYVTIMPTLLSPLMGERRVFHLV